MASPGSHADSDGAAAVCCMCGDHGLLAELFRCGLCRLRLQHRYCSELYPRAATYRSCNWCLREDGDPPPVSEAQTTTAAGGRRSNRNDSRDDVGCSRSEFAAEPGKPVKKPPKKKSHQRTTVQRPAAAAKIGRKTRFRVKVRRYKLLAEVIC